jgi:hypothetical protein
MAPTPGRQNGVASNYSGVVWGIGAKMIVVEMGIEKLLCASEISNT